MSRTNRAMTNNISQNAVSKSSKYSRQDREDPYGPSAFETYKPKQKFIRPRCPNSPTYPIALDNTEEIANINDLDRLANAIEPLPKIEDRPDASIVVEISSDSEEDYRSGFDSDGEALYSSISKGKSIESNNQSQSMKSPSIEEEESPLVEVEAKEVDEDQEELEEITAKAAAEEEEKEIQYDICDDSSLSGDISYCSEDQMIDTRNDVEVHLEANELRKKATTLAKTIQIEDLLPRPNKLKKLTGEVVNQKRNLDAFDPDVILEACEMLLKKDKFKEKGVVNKKIKTESGAVDVFKIEDFVDEGYDHVSPQWEPNADSFVNLSISQQLQHFHKNISKIKLEEGCEDNLDSIVATFDAKSHCELPQVMTEDKKERLLELTEENARDLAAERPSHFNCTWETAQLFLAGGSDLNPPFKKCSAHASLLKKIDLPAWTESDHNDLLKALQAIGKNPHEESEGFDLMDAILNAKDGVAANEVVYNSEFYDYPDEDFKPHITIVNGKLLARHSQEFDLYIEAFVIWLMYFDILISDDLAGPLSHKNYFALFGDMKSVRKFASYQKTKNHGNTCPCHGLLDHHYRIPLVVNKVQKIGRNRFAFVEGANKFEWTWVYVMCSDLIEPFIKLLEYFKDAETHFIMPDIVKQIEKIEALDEEKKTKYSY